MQLRLGHFTEQHWWLCYWKKEGTLECASCRPMSLITSDLYAEALALHVKRVIHALINEDQTGFIKRWLASDNMWSLLHVIKVVDTYPSPCAVFSLDAEKAFDRVEWQYTWAVLQSFGFVYNCISMIKALYHSPFASVLTGDRPSPMSLPLTRTLALSTLSCNSPTKLASVQGLIFKGKTELPLAPLSIGTPYPFAETCKSYG